ncbi:hypothetical protein [Paenibacillus ginsengihumi]|uniref:hypothetical protein n=1 Tax=Paenibacillus ginsengihumi TaxID=431596 RepID=UPI0003608747|nr:hypothetical protein [Paenibacillus ginsengihumi]
MKLNRLFVIMGGACLSLLLIGSAFASNLSTSTVEIISSSFDSLKAKLDQEQNNKLASAVPLAQSDDFQISKQDFVFYKSNMEMIKKLQNQQSLNSSSISDDALINEMLTKEITVSHAKKLGLKVSPQEIEEVIEVEKSALNDPSITGENNEIVREIMKHRIRITGLSEDEFWKSDKIKNEYEKALLMGKLFDKLVEEGKIENDGASFGAYQKELLNNYKGKVTINKSILND